MARARGTPESDHSKPARYPMLKLFEHRAGNPIFGGEPVETRHRALPLLEGHERDRQAPEMTQQEPRPLAHCVAIRNPGTKDRAIQQASAAQQLGELRRVRSVHRVDRITMVRIAEGYRNEEEPACRY